MVLTMQGATYNSHNGDYIDTRYIPDMSLHCLQPGFHYSISAVQCSFSPKALNYSEKLQRMRIDDA